jgi:DNA-3-methyladenine glycosylase II
MAIGKKRELRRIFKMKRLSHTADLEIAAAQLCEIEPRFHGILNVHGMPSLRTSPQGLEGLLLIVTEQFLSLSAAAAIWARVRRAIEPFDAATILKFSSDELLSLGLSRAKAKSFHEIAARSLDGRLVFSEFDCLTEDAIFKKLCALPGVGPWTADIYLLAVMGASDAWPAGDLALRIAIHDFLKLEGRPEIKEMPHHAENWRPHRAVAAQLLWSHYRGLKGLKQA